MIYNLLETIKGYDDQEITEGEGENKKPATWQTIVKNALNENIDSSTTSEDKVKMYTITLKAYQNPEAVDLTADEVSFVLARIRKTFFPIVVGRAEEFFNR